MMDKGLSLEFMMLSHVSAYFQSIAVSVFMEGAKKSAREVQNRKKSIYTRKELSQTQVVVMKIVGM